MGYVRGCDIVGPGMATRVTIGEGGEMLEVSSSMNDMVPMGSFPVKTLEEATRDAQQGTGSMNLHPEVVDPVVTEVGIVYYADPATESNKVLQPVYVFRGPDTCIYVPATEK